jgi:integrase
MRGSIVKRSKTSWALVFRDANNKQKWVKFTPPRGLSARDAYKQAEAELAKLLHQVHSGTYVDASKTTLIEYLRLWHQTNVVPHRRPETARSYASLFEKHVATAPIGAMPLQKIRTSDLEHLYAGVKLAPSSVAVLHAVIARALKIAVRDKLLVVNPATAAEDRPKPSKDQSRRAAREHCWSTLEARKFLAAAKTAGPQASAFFALAIDSGARRSELLGLRWADVDLDAGTVAIARQLEPRSTMTPRWGPPKTDRARVVTLSSDTIARLRKHKRNQREVMMANRTAYRDFGLVFAKEHEHIQKPAAALGQPCPSLPDRQFQQVAKGAGVKRIKFHGLRHSAATLLLGVGVPVQVVAERLGHAQTSMTLDVYTHALPDMQRDAAEKLGALLTSAR